MSWCGMRKPRGEGGETGEGKLVGEVSFMR